MTGFIKYLSALTFLGSVSFAMIDDPQFLLPKTDSFVNGQEFAQAYIPTQEIQFETLECIGQWGCSSPISWVAKVETLNEGEVFINQYTSNNNQLKSRERVQQSEWENIHRNYLRAKLNGIESFGFKVTLTEFSEIPCPNRVFVSAQDRCAQAKASANNSQGFQSDYTFILWRSPTALGQILESIQTDSKPLKRTMKYQLTGFKHH